MVFYWILITLFWITIIVFPEIIAYLLGGFLVFIGLNILFFWTYFKRKTKTNKESYVEVGGYKIYR
jgi:membrane protein implicated in regulation of membrane protease activity